MADSQRDVGVLEFNRKRGIVFLGAVALTLWLVARLWLGPNTADEIAAFPVPGAEIAGFVEVLNGTSIDGLARSVTRTLRIGGIDVVYFGTHRPETDTTRILVRRGDSSLAVVVRGLLGRGTLEILPDSALLVDVSVLLGTDFIVPESTMTR